MNPPRNDVIVQASCSSDEFAACFTKGDGSLFTQAFVSNTFLNVVNSSWKCKKFEWEKYTKTQKIQKKKHLILCYILYFILFFSSHISQ